MAAQDDEAARSSARADAERGPSASRLSPPASVRRRYKLAFWITALLVVLVIAVLPTALASMVEDLRGQGVSAVYDLFTGADIDADQTFAADAAFVNLTVTNIDETQGIVSLIVSGHRVCSAACFPITGTFYSLGSDAAQRRGLPPPPRSPSPANPAPTPSTSSFPSSAPPSATPLTTTPSSSASSSRPPSPTARSTLLRHPPWSRTRPRSRWKTASPA